MTCKPKRIRAMLLFAAIVMSCLSSCSSSNENYSELTNNSSFEWAAGASLIPSQRSGLRRQGISSVDKRYEVTNTGCYYLSYPDNYLIYADHGTDTFVPLCDRPDCAHADYEGKYYYTCNAYFGNAVNIAYFNGYLYVSEYITKDDALNFTVSRLKPDGTEKTTVLDLTEMVGAYESVSQVCVWNGILTFCMSRLDGSGSTVIQPYYYKLDGSMAKPDAGHVWIAYGNDGEKFIGKTMSEDGTPGYILWDPETNTGKYLTDDLGYGYYGADYALVIIDGVILQYHYAADTFITLKDTGLDGNYKLHCFPDCLMISEVLTDEQLSGGEMLTSQHLYFYNWAFEALGSLTLTHERAIDSRNIVCGETNDRIFLAADVPGVPQYYIDKSDFSTGNITLKEIELPTLPLFEGADFVANSSG